MTVTSGFYNSVDGDRKYNAEDFSRFFDGILTDGVLPGVGTEFTVTASGANALVGTGRAWFNKTWTYNDATETMPIPTASTTNPRIDAIVLTVDTRPEVRMNLIEWVVGTPSTSPVEPTLTNPTGRYQYVLATVYRAANSTSIVAGNITKKVGTNKCPMATSALATEQIWDNLSHKRSIVRGQSLGTTFTTAQRNAIKDGSFDGLFLGDYWTFNNTIWRIVDFDYWYDKNRFGPLAPGQNHPPGTVTRIKQHHVVIVPDTVRNFQSNYRPFTSARSAANCGHWNSDNYKAKMLAIENVARGFFGPSTAGLVSREYKWTEKYHGVRNAMLGVPKTTFLSPINEQQLYGNRNFELPMSKNDVVQFALYRHDQRNIWMGQKQGLITTYPPFWTGGVYAIDLWACVHDWVGASADDPVSIADGETHEVRPCFGITGLN